MMAEEKLEPIHPGEVLLEEFLKPMGLSQNRVALDIGVPARRINEIVLGKRRITADTALRLARFFGTSPQFWLGLQMDYDLDVTADSIASRLDREVRPYAVARPLLSSVFVPTQSRHPISGCIRLRSARAKIGGQTRIIVCLVAKAPPRIRAASAG